jgi:AcrR family transcriptional regulator
MPRERARDMQRRRLFDAMAQVLAERGLRGTRVALVCARAQVPPSAFAKLFASLEDCFVQLLEQLHTRSTALMIEAFERESSWEDGVLAGLEALLAFGRRFANATCWGRGFSKRLVAIAPGRASRADIRLVLSPCGIRPQARRLSPG